MIVTVGETMTTKELTKFIGKRMTVIDERTKTAYELTVEDARCNYGALSLYSGAAWFRPTQKELDSIKEN